MADPADGASLCGDDELAYLSSRTRFAEGQRFVFDEPYRLAHLPLVAPDHPLVIARRDGRPESATLSEMIERWWHRPMARFQVDALWLLRSHDDLALDSEVVESVSLLGKP